MNYQILKLELSDPAYSGMTDSEAADALNADDATLLTERLVSYRTILNECDGAGEILDKLETASAAIPDLKWAMVGITADGIDIGNAKTRGMVDQLVVGAVITQVEGDALKAMATSQSKAQSLGLGNVREGDIQFARTL